LSAGSESGGRAADGRPPVTVRGAIKHYGHVVALAGVDLDVARGEAAALVGANGSGKTTLLRLVAGLTRPTAGSVAVLGAPAGSRSARRVLALVPDEPAGLDELTVAEQAALLGALAGAPREAGAHPIAALGLETRRDARLGSLSRGLRRRAALAAALAARPRILLVDEVTATLDVATVHVVRDLVRRHVDAGGSALVTTHDLDFAESACDRVHVLRAGRLVATGPASVTRPLAGLAGVGRREAPAEVDDAVAAG
jgi:ABC-type multidrug transport system ATPase subunit